MRILVDALVHAHDPGPAAAALRTLEHVAGSGPALDPAGTELPLAPFQAEAASRLVGLLETRGGALLADSVGLGKTHVAVAVIAHSMASGQSPVLVVTPAALRGQWLAPLRRLARRHGGPLGVPGRAGPEPGASIHWTSHTRLSLGQETCTRPRLVVVDEAHGFRNPRTRRYRELAKLCTAARVLLVTATPINNALSDLYFPLRLFLGDGQLADLGVADLKDLIRGRHDPEVGRVLSGALAAITVRRTRRVLEPGPDRGPAGFRFPRRDPPVAVRYDLEATWGEAGLAELLDAIAGLGLDGPGANGARGSAEHNLLRYSLLKRLESSSVAFGLSVRRLAGFLRACQDTIRAGRIPGRGGVRAWDPDQLRLPELLFDEVAAGHGDPAGLARSVTADIERTRRIQAVLRSAAGPDPKTEALLELLRGPLAARRVLIFTEFRDTAMHLHQALRRRFRTGLITGKEALLGNGPAARSRVIRAFAPVANGVRPDPGRDLEILVATDVLSEGLNLQDCGDVVSYDLPWNPVRLLQRMGRIDRLGSVHERIRIHNFMPDRGLDAMLGLLERVRSKLETIRTAGALDVEPFAPELAGTVTPMLLDRLRRSDPDVLTDLEIEAETGFEIEERVRSLATARSGRARGTRSGTVRPGGRAPIATARGRFRGRSCRGSRGRPANAAAGW